MTDIKPVSQKQRESELPPPTSAKTGVHQASERQSLPRDKRNTAQIYSQAVVAFQRNTESRQQMVTGFERKIRKFGALIFFVIIFVAILADLLSLVGAGWLLSWTIPLASWFVVRRINRINSASQKIRDVTIAAVRRVTLLQQRLRPLLTGTARNLSVPIKLPATANRRSYTLTFLRDTTITQLIELVPIIDILPFYTGQATKLLFNQNSAHRHAKRTLSDYVRVLSLLERLERLEIDALAEQLSVLVRIRPTTTLLPQTPETAQTEIAQVRFAPA